MPGDTEMEGNERAPSQQSRFLKYTMVQKHMFLRDLLDEWYGEGLYKDGIGGIRGRDKTFGPKWRQHISQAHHSRTKRVVLGMESYAKERNIAVRLAAEELQQEYVEAKCSVSKFVKVLQDKGAVKKLGARGKHKTTDN